MTNDHKLDKGESLAVRARPVVLIAGSLLVLLTILAFGFMVLFSNRIGVRYAVEHKFPGPGVVPDEKAERLALEARQRKALQGAGGRMPIEQAMQAIVTRGPHAFDPVQ